MTMADSIRRLKVRTNADTPYDSENAVKMGAEGIGLCRTETCSSTPRSGATHPGDDRRRRARGPAQGPRQAAAQSQRQDFYGIFKGNGLAGRVTIRLVDPPLHEFVPHDESKQKDLAAKIGVPFEKVKHRIEQLNETNRCSGTGGCRLCITYPRSSRCRCGRSSRRRCSARRRGSR